VVKRPRGTKQSYQLLAEAPLRRLLAHVPSDQIMVRRGEPAVSTRAATPLLLVASPGETSVNAPAQEPMHTPERAVAPEADQPERATIAAPDSTEPILRNPVEELKTPVGMPDLVIRVTPDGQLALIDVAMMFTGLDRNYAARALRRIFEEAHEVNPSRVNLFKFPGRGQKPIAVAPLATSIEIAILLGSRPLQFTFECKRPDFLCAILAATS